MLSHLRFHRRGPSNTTSPVEQPPGWQAAMHQHPQTTYHAVARLDDRPKTSHATASAERPPILPPIARVASLESDRASNTPDRDCSASVEPPAQAEQTEQTGRDSSFIGGIALQNLQDKTLDGRAEPAGNAANSTLHESHLSRARLPPPINTNLARPGLGPVRLAKTFVTPTDLQQQSASTRPFDSDAGLSAPVVETHKSRKSLPFLKNSVSALLMRRRNAQNAPDSVVVPPNEEPTYDPRIRGTRVHDFSAPRPRPVRKSDQVAVLGALPVNQVNENESPLESPEVPEHIETGAKVNEEREPQKSKTRSLEGEPTPASPESPQNDQIQPLRVASCRSSRTLSVDTMVLLQTDSAMSPTASAASSITHDPPHPRHMKSTSSRFSFDMLGSAQQEKLLEERHRQREMEKTEPGDNRRDSRFDDLDDSFDYDDVDDGLEEAIPGVNVELEDNEADADDDQENFAGFVFQRSSSTSASPPRNGRTKDATPDLAPDASDCVEPISPTSPDQLGDALTGLGIVDAHMAYTLEHQNFKESAPWETRHQDLYYDDGLVDELDFEHDGPPFDEALFDLEDTDQYGRPIPGAFARAQEHHKQQASKRVSDVTSRSEALSRSTAHTSVSLEAIPSEETSSGPEVAYQAALAQAAQMAAASGKFRRHSAPSVTCPTVESSVESMDDYETDPFANHLDDYDDFIAEANASALANDDEGFYGQEFGFFSAPLDGVTPKAVLSAENLYQFFNGGFFGPSGQGASQSKLVSREPNLTPITERSEYSNRNSIMALPNEKRNSGPLASPGLAQLAMMADDENMSMSALLRLRSRAWGGSQASLVSSREGSPGGIVEGAPSSPWGVPAWAQHSPALGHHSRKNSAFSGRSGSEAESTSGSPTVKTSLPLRAASSSPSPASPAKWGKSSMTTKCL